VDKLGHLHRPQIITPLVYYPREYYYGRPQEPFGPGHGTQPPAGDDELIEEANGVFDHLLYDQGAGLDGFVLIEET